MANVRNYRTPPLDGLNTVPDVPLWLDRLAADVATDTRQLLGAALGSVDLDTVTAPGRYWQDYPGGVDKVAMHYPEKQTGTLDVTASTTAANVTTQRYTVTNGTTYTRSLTQVGGTPTWSKWAVQSVGSLADSDLDTITTPGDYLQDWQGNTSAARHYPVNVTGVLSVYGPNNSSAAASCVQEFRVIGTSANYGITYRRECNNGAWGTWETIRLAAEAPTAGRTILRDANGRGKVAAPAAEDDIATKLYVDNKVLGIDTAAAASLRQFSLHPGLVLLTNNKDTAPAIAGAVTTNLMTLTTAQQAAYFATPVVVGGWLGGPALENAMGGGSQANIFGLTTDSQQIKIYGTHGLMKPGTRVLVDGLPVDNGSYVEFPSYTGHMSAIYLKFPTKRVRTIEVLAAFKYMYFDTEAGAQVAPYARNTKKVAIMGDSWIDGTTQAPEVVGRRLQAEYPWRTAVLAYGGSGFVSAGPSGQPYTDTRRIDPMAAFAADVTVLWGSINDNSQTPEAVAAAAETMVGKLLAANGAMKIILTGSQINDAAHGPRLAALQGVAANHAGNVVVYDAATAIAASGDTGPWDGAHPSPTGAAKVTQWLAGKIQAQLG
jgi:hypothetical protein